MATSKTVISMTSSNRGGQASAEPDRGPGPRPSNEERYAAGKALRDACPRASHEAWRPPSGRKDPVQLVLQAEKGRIPELLPLRHGRMVRSAFTFYRGAALTMAADRRRRRPPGFASSAAGTRTS